MLRRIFAFAGFASAIFLFLFPSPSFSQAGSVIINEISFKPSWTSAANCLTQSWFEWVKIKNVTNETIDLTDWKLFDNTYSDSLSGTIPAGGYVVIVARESCFRTNFPSFSGSLINLESYLGNGLADSGDKIVIKDQSAAVVDSLDFTSGWSGTSTIAKDSKGDWQESIPTPGSENPAATVSSPSPASETQQTQSSSTLQPVVTFSAPSAAVSGQEFSVEVSLSNFESGTYFVKVLVGKDGKLIYGNTKGASGWLTQNASWADFPTMTGSGTVQAKVDDDAAAGDYVIKVRVHQDDTNYDSVEKGIAISSSPAVAAANTADTSEEEEIESSPIANSAEEGQVLGEAVPKEKNSKLNFYLILGLFGLLVGSGGLILAFRKNS